MPGAKTPEWTPTSWEATFGRRAESRLVENWPTDKRIAVLLTFDTQADIDAARPNYQVTTVFPDGSVNYVDQMERQYEVFSGLPRILRVLREHGVQATFPTCGSTADWYPDSIRAIAQDGHELAAHSYWHHNMKALTRDEQLAEIEDCALALEKLSGERPVGWRSPMFTGTGETLDLVVDLGFQWAGDFANDDFAYWIERPNGRVLAIPSCMNDIDMSFMQPWGAPIIHANGNFYRNGHELLQAWQEEFDVLYKESGPDHPAICSLTFHPRVTGRPFRAWALDAFIDYASSHEGVWFPRVKDLVQLA